MALVSGGGSACGEDGLRFCVTVTAQSASVGGEQNASGWHPAWPSLAGVGGALPRSGAFSGLSLTASPCEGPSCGDRLRSRGQNLPWEEAGPLCLPTLPCAHLGGGDLHSLRCSLFFRKSELPYPRDFLNSKEKPLTVGMNN